jgi:hypothetical protein
LARVTDGTGTAGGLQSDLDAVVRDGGIRVADAPPVPTPPGGRRPVVEI